MGFSGSEKIFKKIFFDFELGFLKSGFFGQALINPHQGWRTTLDTFVSNIKILVRINNYIEVTPEILSCVVAADQYRQETSPFSQYITYVKTKSKVEIQTITEEEIITPQTVDIEEIMGENNRLTRENDLLKEKLAKLTPTNLSKDQTMTNQ